MKYLDYPVLTQLSEVLSSNPSPEARVNARVEAYSIKPGTKERKMYKEMEEQYVSGQEDMDEMSFSPEMKEAGLSSCFGRLDVKESRKVHYLLVSTLNSAFPGYDFSALRPDHFMREISVSQVLSNLSSNLLAIDAVDLSPLAVGQPNSSPILAPTHGSGTSPSNAEVGNPSLYRILNDVLPLNECEAYSWFPEPEYDPHVDPEENEEASEYDEDSDDDAIEDDSMDIDIDGEGAYVSWGQAGMELELEGVPSSSSSKPRSSSFSGIGTYDFADLITSSPRLGPIGEVGEWSPPRKVGGLLWSANYFFYCRPKKRILFITTWSRKRLSHDGESGDIGSTDNLPLPISSSFTPPASSMPAFTALPTSKPRQPRAHHNLSNARPNHRRKAPSKLATGKTLSTATIPIRGLSNAPSVPATPSRLAASAPSSSTLLPLTSPANMRSTPGLRPRQTTARMLINAAAATRPTPSSGISKAKAAATSASSSGAAEGESSRVRKERSGSLTPGPMLGLVDVAGPNAVSDAAKGKRVKV